jgi:hypothetical protein
MSAPFRPVHGANRRIGMVIATTSLLLVLAATAARAGPLDSDRVGEADSSRPLPTAAADRGRDRDEVEPTADALIISAAIVVFDGSAQPPGDADVALRRRGADAAFLDELVNQYFDDYN